MASQVPLSWVHLTSLRVHLAPLPLQTQQVGQGWPASRPPSPSHQSTTLKKAKVPSP